MTREQQLTAMLIPFYLGEQPDSKGRKIQAIWEWAFDQLEQTHDYIQWLFPIAEKSAFNLDSPLVNDSVIQAFQTDPKLRENLLRSLNVMLQFYGLECHQAQAKEIIVTKSKDYSTRKREWMYPLNHNYLRITRILKCLTLFGLVDEAHAFYDCLRQIYQEDVLLIETKTFHYWTNALKMSSNF